MAEAAALSATIKVLLGPAISLATDRARLVLGFEEELEKLSQSATTIWDFLDDGDKKMQSPTVRNWLKQLEGEAIKMGNVLDELNYERLRREVKYRNQLKKKVCFFFSYFNTMNLHSKLASKIKEINANLERIYQQASGLGLVAQCRTDPALPPDVSRLTDSIPDPNVVVRANDESEIVEMLLRPTESVVSVIPITGMGGIGKTTLAKSVYNSPQIDHHFGENKFWVCVAREINIMELFKVISVRLTGEEVRVDDRDVVVKKIGDKLQSKKYLLVLDDVWNEERTLWNDFFTTLEGLNPTNGSWCLVTTRVTSVAEAMNCYPHSLGKLPDDECWSILTKMALAGEEVPKELEDLKEQILRKCDGLPLAAKLIGGLLRTTGREKWRSIAEDGLSDEDQGKIINQVLRVSFDHLSPPSVKKCFAYCAIFPQDTELEEDKLIQHWIAKGFVLPDQENNRMMEETGSVYWRILLQNSLLEKVEEEWPSERTYYKMHDLVHDFAKSILNPESSNQDRYLALSSSEGLTENTKMTIPASIHTLFLHLQSGTSADMFLADMLSRFKHLHVLKLSGDDVKFLPSSIDQLLHLRLLDISSSGIKSLPESLCKLYNLQTLTMKRGALERGFPKRMSNLISLRHLNYYHDGDVEFKMLTQIRRLTCLQTLRFFNVSQEKGCGVEELGTLKYLKGSLEIRNLGLVRGKEAAKQAKLFEKPDLTRLEFRWEKSEDRKSDNYDEDVLEGLQPHQNLQELEIHYFFGNKFPQWFMNLSELVKLRIENCERCSELPTLGQLPSLKRLYLSRLDNIQFVGDEFYGITDEKEEGRPRGPGSSTRRRKFFPALEELHVKGMKNLVEWKDADRSTISEAELDVIPMSREFTIRHCPRLTTLPCLSKILKVENCPKFTSIINGTSLEELTLEVCDNLRELPEGLIGSSLRELRIDSCSSLICLGVNGQKCPLPCLELLVVSDCDELTTIPDKMFESCTSLRHLSVLSCPNLEQFSLNLQETPSLEAFYLEGCPKLIPQWFKGFASATRLRELSICPFSLDHSSIDGFDWSGLISAPALRVLQLQGLPHTDYLPDQLKYLTSLTSLSLHGFGGIEVLPDWIGDLVSLEVLRLLDCKKLRSLPSETAMRRLTKLTCLHVEDCRLLRKRYTPEKGIYTPKKYDLAEWISSDPASSESEEEEIDDNEQPRGDGEQKSIDSAQTSASRCFPLLLKKKSSGDS